MRGVLAWLVMFGVVAGLSARTLPAALLGGHSHGHADVVMPVDSCDADEPDHAHHHHHHHHDPLPCEHDGSDHPCHDPHHHHGCCSPVTISSEVVRECRLSPPGGVLLGFTEWHARVPDDPYLEGEAPPLI